MDSFLGWEEEEGQAPTDQTDVFADVESNVDEVVEEVVRDKDHDGILES